MVRLAVKPDLLRWAADRGARTENDLASKFPKLAKWLNGDELPTLRQLEEFARATSTPLGFLFLQKPPVESLGFPHFRTTTDKPVTTASADLLDTVYQMQRRQDWLSEYLQEQGRDPVPLVGSAKLGDDIRSVAGRIRESLKLDIDWASHTRSWEESLRVLNDAASDAGIVVVTNGVVGNNTHRKLDVADFRGFVLVDRFAPLIFVNGADYKSAQMFTIAHELAHLAYGQSAAFDLRNLESPNAPIEKACNQVAAEFLVPAVALTAFKSSGEVGQDARRLAQQFKVGQIVAARRLLDVGRISRKQFFAFYDDYISRERGVSSDKAGGDFYNTAPHRIGKRFAVELLRAVSAGNVLITDAYRLTGLKGETYHKFAQAVRAGGDA
jgi:Zn-dependent peptidase ImmA (M78 family)